MKPCDWSQHVEPTHVMVGIDHGSDEEDEVEDEVEDDDDEVEEDDDEIAVEGAGAVDLLKYQLYSS